MFGSLKSKSGDTYAFNFDAAKKRCRIILIDDDMPAPLFEALKAEGYNAHHYYKPEPGVATQCETAVYDIVALDHAALSLFDRIRNSNPAQYLIVMAAQPDHPAVVKYFQSANGNLKKPFDLPGLKAVLDAGIKALFDRNQLLAEMSAMLLKAKVSKTVVDLLVESLKKEVPSTIGAVGKQVRDTIKPVPLPTDLPGVLWQLVKIRE
jgi:DNA-binding NtrC family response regulator